MVFKFSLFLIISLGLVTAQVQASDEKEDYLGQRRIEAFDQETSGSYGRIYSEEEPLLKEAETRKSALHQEWQEYLNGYKRSLREKTQAVMTQAGSIKNLSEKERAEKFVSSAGNLYNLYAEWDKEFGIPSDVNDEYAMAEDRLLRNIESETKITDSGRKLPADLLSIDAEFQGLRTRYHAKQNEISDREKALEQEKEAIKIPGKQYLTEREQQRAEMIKEIVALQRS